MDTELILAVQRAEGYDFHVVLGVRLLNIEYMALTFDLQGEL